MSIQIRSKNNVLWDRVKDTDMAKENHLLASLPRDVYEKLAPHLQYVSFNYPTLLRSALRRRFVESGDCIYRPAQFRIPEKAFGFTFIRRRIRDS